MRNSYGTLLLVMAFFVSSIGAKDCEFNKPSSSPAPPPSAPPSDKPFCMVDPPPDCVAYCVDVDQVDFTLACSDKGSGPITAQFKENIYEYVQLVHGEGKLICNDADTMYGPEALIEGNFVTPCSIGYTPQVLKSESLDACTAPPPWCS